MDKTKPVKPIGKKEEEILVRKSLKYSTKDAIATTVMTSAGDNFISPYAVALNANNFQIGLLSALPNLVPAELLTSRAMEKYPRKKIVLSGVLVQILIWPLIALLGIFSMKNPSLMPILPLLLIVLFTIYASGGLFGAPAWASWMKDLVSKIKIGKYFGMRNKVCGIVSLVVIIAGGIILDGFKKAGYLFWGFALLFFVASFSRLIARIYLKKQYEPQLKSEKEYYFSFWQFVKKAPTNNYGRFAIFIALINFSVMLAGPFFTPYMLNGLKFDYITFTIINLVISGTATFMTMPFWGRFIDKYGCVRTMRTTVWMLPVLPLLWIISPSPYWLAAVQITSGISWAGFNLAAGTFTYNAVSKERMNLCVAYTSLMNGIAIFLGATIGGLIASLNITFMSIFFFIFLISGIARIAVIGLFFPLIREVKAVKPAEPFLKIVLKSFKDANISHFIYNLYPREISKENPKKKDD